MYSVTVKVLKIHILSLGEQLIADRNSFLCILCIMRMLLTLCLFSYYAEFMRTLCSSTYFCQNKNYEILNPRSYTEGMDGKISHTTVFLMRWPGGPCLNYLNMNTVHVVTF
jgi:hypothetical protein